MKIKTLLLIMVSIFLLGCTEADNNTITNETNIIATDNATLIIVEEDGTIGCFSTENNGSDCTYTEEQKAIENIIKEQ